MAKCESHCANQYTHSIRNHGPLCRTVSSARRTAGCESWSASRGGDYARICSKDFDTGHFEVGFRIVGRIKNVDGVAGVRPDQRWAPHSNPHTAFCPRTCPRRQGERTKSTAKMKVSDEVARERINQNAHINNNLLFLEDL